MRELTVRIRFVQHSLGNQKLQDGTGRFVFSRSPCDFEQGGRITFLASWHQANMRLASQLLGRHQDEVRKIYWDIHVEGQLRSDCWYRVYYGQATQRRRYSLHEAFFPGEIVGIHCLVPSVITDEDLWQLVQKAGQYKGLSPWKPGEYGKFEVMSIRPR